MILTPSSFTHEYLSSLKFKELQKLSAQFHVNKRWAKKQELIENLLALKEKEENMVDNNQDQRKQWRDGSTVFNDLQQNNDKEVNRRLTFNVKKSSVEYSDTRLTFEVSQNGKNLLDKTFNSREMYYVSPSIIDLEVEPLTESRGTFEIPPKEKLMDVDPRATFEIAQNGSEFLDENEPITSKKLNAANVKKTKNLEIVSNEVGFKQNLGSIKFNLSIQDGEIEKGKEKLQVKTLTIPCARVTRRTRKDGEASRTDDSPIKMSKKSINIKKSTRLPISKNNLIRSVALSSINKESIIQTLSNPQSKKITQSKEPLNFSDVKLVGKTDNNKENVSKILRKRISKTMDKNQGKISNAVKVNFRTPPPSISKSSRAMPLRKTPLKKGVDGKLNKNVVTTPGVKSASKPITATKMPDFSKIHKKQFEQMDSLHDYLKKKEERIRKLFGTPQPGQQLQGQNKTAPVFRFQSKTAEKENKENEALKRLMTPLKKENDSKITQKEAFKSKLPPLKLRSEIKDKNRSYIHGVRTNKRFELQMKFRNM